MILLKRLPYLYIVFFTVTLTVWGFSVSELDIISLYRKHFWALLTMIFGSFIAGSSPEGSAAIAYPIFTLLLKISPDVARNFAFAIQSIGMTSASLLILGLKVRVDWKYIKYVTLGGVFGLIAGTYWVVPLISPPIAKLFFVSLWLSFGIILWNENRKTDRHVLDTIRNFTSSDALNLIFFGVIGGVISSIFGTGINIFTFCLMTVYYGINEKVAVPSSIIIMTLETILGFFLHKNIIGDFQTEAYEMWLVCIPFVIIFAPLGSFVMSKLPRKAIAGFLYFILVIQFIGAIWVIKPNFEQSLMSGLTILTGVSLFHFLSKIRKKEI
ncbi:MAG: sulfite exporter TauE/SafE family protein [Cytophagaceae bacterium]|nr:sulfite exporter TauE/SafE family protein [Cytophagaceae bacterium]